MPVVRRRKHPIVRIALIIVGVLLIALTPVVGPIPGPGGIIVFAGGLVLLLQNSGGARRVYARTKRRWPRFARYSEMALRRRSWRRRRDRDREIALAAAEAKAAVFGAGPR